MKQNKSTAKWVGFGIANTAIAAEQDKAKTAWAIAEVTNAMQEAQNTQFDKMMVMMKDFMSGAQQGTTPHPTNQHTSRCTPYTQCWFQHGQPDKDCWELEANKAKCPANWQPVIERKKKVSFATWCVTEYKINQIW